ncbi:MAG TPA: hypothetical protein VGC41_10225 [Kofleriaceae bacterium]
MSSPVAVAVATYIQANRERDPAVRARLLEECFAETGRFVTRSKVYDRAGLTALLTDFVDNPNLVGFRVTHLQSGGTMFRYRSIVERNDGTELEFFDAGELDADGRIATMLVFSGPLPEHG